MKNYEQCLTDRVPFIMRDDQYAGVMVWHHVDLWWFANMFTKKVDSFKQIALVHCPPFKHRVLVFHASLAVDLERNMFLHELTVAKSFHFDEVEIVWESINGANVVK